MIGPRKFQYVGNTLSTGVPINAIYVNGTPLMVNGTNVEVSYAS